MSNNFKLFLGNKQVLVESNEVPISNKTEETFNNTDANQSDVNKTFKKEIEDRQKNLINTDNAIKLIDNVNDNKVDISVNLSEDEKIIIKSEDGLSTNLSIKFNNEIGEVQLIGKEEQLISSTKIPSGADTFIGGRVEINPVKEEQVLDGTFLILTFEEDGNILDTYINITPNVDTGKHIVLNNDKSISVEEGFSIPTEEDLKKFSNKQNTLISRESSISLYDTANNAFTYIDLNISSTDKFLSKENDGVNVNLQFSYNTDTGVLTILGKENVVIDEINLPLRSFLKSSSVEINPVKDGETLEGTYLILVFSNEDNIDTTNYIDLTQLVDVYTSTNKGLTIEDFKITLNIDNTSNLVINDNGLSVADTHIIISKEEKEKYDKYESIKQNILTAGDNVKINENSIISSKFFIQHLDTLPENTENLENDVFYCVPIGNDIPGYNIYILLNGQFIKIANIGLTETVLVNGTFTQNDDGSINLTIVNTEGVEVINTTINDLVYKDFIQTLTNKTIDADNNTISNLTLTNMKDGIVDKTSLFADDDTHIASSKLIKEMLDTKQNTLTAGENIEIVEEVEEGTGKTITKINGLGKSIIEVEELPQDNINNEAIYRLAVKDGDENITGYNLYYYDTVNGFIRVAKGRETIKSINKSLNIVDNTYKIKTELKNADNTIITTNELDITENIVNSNTEFSSFANTENSDKKFVTKGYFNKVMTNIPNPTNDMDVANKKYVDNEITASNRGFKFIGYISTEEPANPNELDLWYNSTEVPTTFPIAVKKYENGAWSTDTIEYTPSTMELWSDKNTGNGLYWFGDEWNIIDFKILTDNETIELANDGKIKIKSIIKEVETLPEVEQDQSVIYHNIEDNNFYLYGGTYTETPEGHTKVNWILLNNQLQNLQAGEGIKIEDINNKIVISSTGAEKYIYRGIFNDINSTRYLLTDTLADKDVVLLVSDNQYYQYKEEDDTFYVVVDADIINNLKNKQDKIQDTDDVRIENNISILTDDNGDNIIDANGNIIKQVKKNILVKNPEFLGIYKDSSLLSNYKDGDIIYNDTLQTYQSFNKENNLWDNYDDLRTIQSIKSFQTAIKIPGNSPLQFSRRLKEGSTVELEEVLTSDYTRMRWDKMYITYEAVVALPDEQKHNGDVFILKDESYVLYTCNYIVDENYNVTVEKEYTYVKDNRRVDLNPANYLEPYSSSWSFAWNSFGMWLKGNTVELNGYITLSTRPTISSGFNNVFKLDSTTLKEGYIVDSDHYRPSGNAFLKRDVAFVYTNSKYMNGVLQTNVLDANGNMTIQLYCTSDIVTSLNNKGGGINITNYFIHLKKK